MIEHGEVDDESDEEASGEKFGAGEIVEVCHNGEGDHGGGDGDADGDGVVDDVFHELVLNASGVRLQGENEAGEADAGEV